MAPELRTLFSRLSALALTVLALTSVSCSTVKVGPGGQISKVKYYYLVPTHKPVNTQDVAIKFERDYHLYGAVTKKEILARGGHYYTIFWKANDRTQPVTVRFEYRQTESGLITKSFEDHVTDVRKSNESKFEVIGDLYEKYGRVTAWRVTLLRGKEELASQESYLWR